MSSLVKNIRNKKCLNIIITYFIAYSISLNLAFFICLERNSGSHQTCPDGDLVFRGVHNKNDKLTLMISCYNRNYSSNDYIQTI